MHNVGKSVVQTGKFIGFLLGYLVFTTVLFFVFVVTKRVVMTGYHYITFCVITALIALVGYSLKRWLR